MNVRRTAALAAICLVTSGCVSSLKPALPMPTTSITLSTKVDAGKIETPDPHRTFDLPANTILLVVFDAYPGFEWHADNAQNTSVLSDGGAQTQEQCPTGSTDCVISQAEQYLPESTGTTKIVFTLVATGGSSASPTSEPSSVPTGGSACPAGITAPPPTADIGCVLGTVTLTVKVG